MQHRPFSRTGWQVNPIGFGAWAIGGSWGEVSDRDAEAAINAALDGGVNFIDTADVYGGGRSEKLIAKVLKARGGKKDIVVATKAGRKLSPHVAEAYTIQAITGFVEQSLKNLETDALGRAAAPLPADPGLFQRRPVRRARQAGAGRQAEILRRQRPERGRSDQGDGLSIVSIQIIFNMLRQKPIEKLFDRAKQKNVAIIARVPLASGLLTGKMKPDTKFAQDDHRNFNIKGEAFDVGETFSGVPYDVGLAAVEKLRPIVSGNATLAATALRWILMFDAVTVAIPGAKNVAQAESNAAAGNLPALTKEQMAAVKQIYDADIRPLVHHRW